MFLARCDVNASHKYTTSLFADGEKAYYYEQARLLQSRVLFFFEKSLFFT